MKEFKGYPAPWDMRINDGMAIFDFNHKGEIPHYRFAECVVSLVSDDEPQGYLMANAYLIASAPKLLEHLQKCVEALEEVSYQSWCGQIIDEARAEIAKALGETK